MTARLPRAAAALLILCAALGFRASNDRPGAPVQSSRLELQRSERPGPLV